MMKFDIGQTVDLQVKYHSIQYKDEGEKTRQVKGQIVQSPKWLDSDYVSVMTGNPNYPVSHVFKGNIVGFDLTRARIDSRMFIVRSKSKGKTYNVISSNGEIKCDCIGYQYRKYCKHSTAVKKFIQNA
jgi:hypothetical protein